MKGAIIVALALGLALTFFFYRKRLKLAILIGGGLYLVVLVVRFVSIRDETDRMIDLLLALGAMLALWLGVYGLTRFLRPRLNRRRGR